MRNALLAALVIALGASTVALAAFAAGDERRATEAMLAGLEHGDPNRKVLTQDLAKRAREALERAARMRAAGDETHARLADGLAREWAEAALDLARAADAETRAAAARSGAIDAGALAERERALLEEGIAHNGRLRAEIDQIGRERAEQPARTSAVGLDGGTAAPGTPAGRRSGGAGKPTDAGADR